MENFQEGGTNIAPDSQSQDSFSAGSPQEGGQSQQPQNVPEQVVDPSQVVDTSFSNSDYFNNIASRSINFTPQYQQPIYQQPQYQQPVPIPQPVPISPAVSPTPEFNLDYDEVADYLDARDMKGLFGAIDGFTQSRAQALFAEKQADLMKIFEQRINDSYESRKQAEAVQQIGNSILQGLVKNNIVLNQVEAQAVEQQIVNVADIYYQNYVHQHNAIALAGQLNQVPIAKNADGSPLTYNDFVTNLGIEIAKQYKKGMNTTPQTGIPNNMVRQTMTPVVQAGSASRMAAGQKSDADRIAEWNSI